MTLKIIVLGNKLKIVEFLLFRVLNLSSSVYIMTILSLAMKSNSVFQHDFHTQQVNLRHASHDNITAIHIFDKRFDIISQTVTRFLLYSWSYS